MVHNLFLRRYLQTLATFVAKFTLASSAHAHECMHMANKTIYFRDDALWSKAKTMAGKEGLSAVIQKAVERFVAEGERKKEGLQRFTLSVMLPYEEDPEQIAPGDRIAFDGQLLFNMGGVAVDDGSSASHDIECYRTRAGKLIFTTTGSSNDVGEITCTTAYTTASRI